MEQSEKFFTHRVITTALVIVAILGGILYYFYYVRVNQMNIVSEFNNAYNSALAMLVNGSTDVTTTIAELQKLYNTAPNKETQAKVEQSLVTSLFRRNVGDDRSMAIALVEKTAADTESTPRSRAIALTLLASLVRNEDDSFFRQYFSGTTLSKYLPPDGVQADSLNIAIKMFKDAEAIYPTPYAEYYIAYVYTLLIRAEELIVTDGSANIENMARVVQTYIKKGDETIRTDANYVSSTLAYFYYMRAFSLSNSARILGNMTVEERETAYKDALAKISVLTTDPYVIDALFKTKFRYAVLLLNNTKGRESDIQIILSDFGILNPELSSDEIVSDSFKSIQRTNSAITKKSIAGLADISPEFKGCLLKLDLKL